MAVRVGLTSGGLSCVLLALLSLLLHRQKAVSLGRLSQVASSISEEEKEDEEEVCCHSTWSLLARVTKGHNMRSPCDTCHAGSFVAVQTAPHQ